MVVLLFTDPTKNVGGAKGCLLSRIKKVGGATAPPAPPVPPPLAIVIYSSSNESPKPYLFAQNLKNSIPALLRYLVLAQRNPILVHTEPNGCISFWLAVLVIKVVLLQNFIFGFIVKG